MCIYIYVKDIKPWNAVAQNNATEVELETQKMESCAKNLPQSSSWYIYWAQSLMIQYNLSLKWINWMCINFPAMCVECDLPWFCIF